MSLRMKIVAATLLAVMALAGAAQAAEVTRNETVYVALANDGTVREVRLAAWVRGVPAGTAWTDYGRYSDVANSLSAVEPALSDDRLVWPEAAAENGDLVYQATVAEKLPIRVDIAYRLDGKAVSAAELAGKDGELEMTVHVENLLASDENITYTGFDGKTKHAVKRLFTPLMFQLSLSVPMSKWTHIEAPGATEVLVGDQMQLSWGVFPMPEADMVVRMHGQNIALDPISMVAVPMAPPITEPTGDAELKQMIAGLTATEQGLTALIGGVQAGGAGVKSLSDGLGQLQAGHTQLTAGFAALANGDPRLEAIAQQLAAEQQAISQLSQAAAALAGGLGGSAGGKGPDAMVAGISAMKEAAIVQYDAVRLGQATVARLQQLADNYRSFADNGRNANSQTQFLLRTDGLKAPEVPATEQQAEPLHLSLWQRFVRFLRGDR